jgi:hypothetical protein
MKEIKKWSKEWEIETKLIPSDFNGYIPIAISV